MQSKISFFNKTIFKKNIKNCIWIMIVYLIILCGYTFLASLDLIDNVRNRASITDVFMTHHDAYSTDVYRYIESLSGEVGYVISALCAIVAVVFIFSYLYSTKTGYMMASFPVTRFELYTTGVLSVITVFAIPQIIALAMNIAVGLFVGVDGAVGYALYAFLCQFLVMCFFVAFSSCVAMTSGQAITVLIFYVIFNFCYCAIRVAMSVLTSTICFGQADYFTWHARNVLTPIIYIPENIGLKTRIIQSGATYSIILDYGNIAALIGYTVATAAIFALGYYLYKRKHMETVADFITVPVLKPVFKWGVSFFVSIVLGSGFATLVTEVVHMAFNGTVLLTLITSLFFGTLIFFGCQMLNIKSFKIFTKHFIGETEIFLGAILIVFVIFAVDLPGIERKVPDVSEISEVKISVAETANIVDADEIAKVVEFHKQLVDARGALKKNKLDGDYNYISINYVIPNGKGVSRSYRLPDDKNISPEYKKAYSTLEELTSSTDFAVRHKLCMSSETKDYEKVHAVSFSLDKYVFRENSAEPDGGYANWDIDSYNTNDSEIAEAIYRAYVKDVCEGNFNGTFLFDGADERWKTRYMSDLFFNLVAEDGEKVISDGYIQYDDVAYVADTKQYDDSRSISVSFNANAKNTIAALLEYGIIDTIDELITNEEFNSK